MPSAGLPYDPAQVHADGVGAQEGVIQGPQQLLVVVLIKRGPAAVGLIVWELVSWGVAGFLALAVESDFGLIRSSAVLVQLTLNDADRLSR